ncbi:MAG: hypothetical protein MZV63_58925 [Marinilabiliales bacterium]|nr:hypothetical protein [Marinilabiliales bacterium]
MAQAGRHRWLYPAAHRTDPPNPGFGPESDGLPDRVLRQMASRAGLDARERLCPRSRRRRTHVPRFLAGRRSFDGAQRRFREAGARRTDGAGIRRGLLHGGLLDHRRAVHVHRE